jgi:hypothetical protein
MPKKISNKIIILEKNNYPRITKDLFITMGRIQNIIKTSEFNINDS